MTIEGTWYSGNQIIESFHVTSYQTNFISHRTRRRYAGFLSPQAGMGKYNKMSKNFFFI